MNTIGAISPLTYCTLRGTMTVSIMILGGFDVSYKNKCYQRYVQLDDEANSPGKYYSQGKNLTRVTLAAEEKTRKREENLWN
jgi:hypothetical protein